MATASPYITPFHLHKLLHLQSSTEDEDNRHSYKIEYHGGELKPKRGDMKFHLRTLVNNKEGNEVGYVCRVKEKRERSSSNKGKSRGAFV